MASRFEEFDRSRLKLAPLAERRHGFSSASIMSLRRVDTVDDTLRAVAERIKKAAGNKRSVIMMIGAHVLRAGVQNYVIDLMQRGLVSCIAMNGAGVIHDYELALIGATTESVSYYIRDGRFGMWLETGRINDIIANASQEALGLGEAVGKTIETEDFPHREISILSTAYRLGIPVTVHVGIGYDIIHELPNCNGAALGDTSYRDFLIFARVLENLEGGVVMNFGSAVMAPEVYLKALSMARNVAFQKKTAISRFATLVCDLVDLPQEGFFEQRQRDVHYYFRPWKTMLVRTVANYGEGFYVKGRHSETIPSLWTALTP